MGFVDRGRMPKPLTTLFNMGRSYSLWVYQWGLACCAIEMGAAFASPRYDVMRLGVIPFPASARARPISSSISGTVTDKMAPAIKRLYEQMPEPKYVISMGSCANCGGPYWDSLLGHQGRRPDHPGRRLRARAARRGPRPCSRASCCCRSASERGHGSPLARRGTSRCMSRSLSVGVTDCPSTKQPGRPTHQRTPVRCTEGHGLPRGHRRGHAAAAASVAAEPVDSLEEDPRRRVGAASRADAWGPPGRRQARSDRRLRVTF